MATSQEHNQSEYARPQIHRVPPELRLNSKQNNQVYDPVIVSIGPYHHGKPEFQRAQEFKYRCLDWCTSGQDNQKDLFYNKILKRINKLRGCYADVSCVNKYGDQALAQMMLLDACFIINFMVIRRERGKMFRFWCSHLGMAAVLSLTAGDIMMLENQIPFKVLQLIIRLRNVEEESEVLIQKFVTWMMPGKPTLSRIPGEEKKPPLHILEACYRVIADQDMSTYQKQINVRFPARMLGELVANEDEEIPDDNEEINDDEEISYNEEINDDEEISSEISDEISNGEEIHDDELEFSDDEEKIMFAEK